MSAPNMDIQPVKLDVTKPFGESMAEVLLRMTKLGQRTLPIRITTCNGDAFNVEVRLVSLTTKDGRKIKP